MPHRINMALVCLHIAATIYLAMGVVVLALRMNRGDPLFLAITLTICGALAAGIELIAWGLRRRKFWAWITGLCTFGIFLPSLFLPLGGLGLWGLLDAGSRAQFGIGQSAQRGFDVAKRD